LSFNTKKQKSLKYLPAEKLLAIAISVRRNILPRVLDYKNLSINVNSNFYANFVLTGHAVGLVCGKGQSKGRKTPGFQGQRSQA